MSEFLARRFNGLTQSDIRRLTRECEAVDGINLGQGICDLPTPAFVREAAMQAVAGPTNTYSLPEGTPALREAIVEKLERDNRIKADPTSEVVVTAGATGAFVSTLTALLNPGDGIILFEPYYGYHYNIALVSGMVPQVVELFAPSYRVTEEALRASVQWNTRAIVVCTPANPSGKMFDRTELELIAKVAHEHDLLVVTDEIYEYIRYDGREHLSPATVGDLWERTVTVMGLSKTFSITGWRIGFAVAPKALAQAINLANDVMYLCAPTPLQHAVVAGLRGPRSYFESLQSIYQKKRDMLCAALADSGMQPIVPQGAYYVLADISKWGYRTAADAAAALLDRTKVSAIPGSAFYKGTHGEPFLRFCFAKDDSILEEACRRLRAEPMMA